VGGIQRRCDDVPDPRKKTRKISNLTEREALNFEKSGECSNCRRSIKMSRFDGFTNFGAVESASQCEQRTCPDLGGNASFLVSSVNWASVIYLSTG
jgi:hypothetical protein